MSQLALSAGQKIELNDGRVGTIRFVGNTAFQTGEWVGVELDENSGKNDGSVQGRRYFECAPGYGIFCRPGGISQMLEEPKPKAKATSNGPPKARPNSIQGPPNSTRRQTLQQDGGPGKRASLMMQGTPTPVPGARSPAKSPTKQLGSNTNGTANANANANSSSRTATPPVASTASKRPTSVIAPKSSRQSMTAAPSSTTAAAAASRRTSTVPTVPSTGVRPARQPAAATTTSSRTPAARSTVGSGTSLKTPATARSSANLRTRLSATRELSSGGDAGRPDNVSSSRESAASETTGQEGVEEDREDAVRNFAPPPVPNGPSGSDRTSRSRRPSSPAAASIHSQRTIRSTAQSTRQIEELEAKIRILERKRQEDRELKQGLEKAEQERDQYKGIIEKLQNKYRPQQQEMEKLKQELSECQKQVSEVEDLKAKHELELESAWVDREYAEEQADLYKADLEILRTKNEANELDLEILREENTELSKEMSPEERTTAGWLQLEKSNERLRDALISLRDITQDKEAELKEQIDGLEDQLKEAEGTKTLFDETREQLLRSQADTEDLRQQLEVAVGAEDMIERLTEDNESLRDKINDLRAAIDDLEALRELNDELEINHVEAEKQLQEEIDFKDSILFDRERTAREQQAALDEAEYNINRFRELVTQMQSDLQDLEASKQISESEATELSNKSRAMMDLNHKLQSSAAKTQVKTMDLELRKLDAEQASEHLAIVQLFLPDSFENERDSVLALLRFKRIGFKANLVQGFIKERIASFDLRGEDEEVFAACDALDKLAWIAGMAERLVNSVSSCSANEFAQYGGALYELEVVERTLNDYIDALRRDDLKESDMTVRLRRSIEVITHLSSLHLHGSLTDHADDLIMKVTLLQSRMDSTTAALTLARTMIEKNFSTSANGGDDDKKSDVTDDENASDTALLLTRLKAVIDVSRNAKVVSGKTYRALADLQDRSLTLEESLMDHFESADAVATAIATYASQSGSRLQEIFGEEGRIEPFTPYEVASALSQTATSVFEVSGPESGPYATLAARLRDLGALLADLSTLPTDLDNTVEFERAPAPWVARANEMRLTKITSIDIEAELARTRETVRERESLVKQKETELEEQSVRIEMLEARMKDASKRSARIAELERGLREAKENETTARKDLARARQEAQHDLERARDEVARQADDDRPAHADVASGKDLDGNAMGASVRLTLERLQHKIAALEGAVRYLKDDNCRLRTPDPTAPHGARRLAVSLDWLQPPLPRQQSHEGDNADPSSSLLLATTKKTQKHHAAPPASVRREGERVLEQLLSLASLSPSVDLTSLPKNKLAWRPLKDHSRWRVEQRNEEWVDWKDWRSGVLKQGFSHPTAPPVAAATVVT